MKNSTLILVVVALIIIGGGAVFAFTSGAFNSKSTESTNTNQTSNNNSSNTSSEEKCIITVNSTKYDVTQFRKMHPGGDIYKCGTDMTSTFYSKHTDSKLTELEKYKVD